MPEIVFETHAGHQIGTLCNKSNCYQTPSSPQPTWVRKENSMVAFLYYGRFFFEISLWDISYSSFNALRCLQGLCFFRLPQANLPNIPSSHVGYLDAIFWQSGTIVNKKLKKFHKFFKFENLKLKLKLIIKDILINNAVYF